MPIYKITNIITGYFYVGKTERTIDERMRCHLYDSRKSQTHLHRAIRKYGRAAFSIELLEACLDDDLDSREKHWIAMLEPKYNMTAGGDGGPTHHLESWKEGMARRRSLAGENNPAFGKGGMAGKTHSEEVRARMAETHRQRWAQDPSRSDAAAKRVAGVANPMYGKTPANSKKIEYMGVTYPSLAAASRATGRSPDHIKKRGKPND